MEYTERNIAANETALAELERLGTGTFHLLSSHAEHATTAWRLFAGLLLVLTVVVVRLIRTRQSAAYINTAIGRLVFVGLFSYLVGKTGNQDRPRV